MELKQDGVAIYSDSSDDEYAFVDCIIEPSWTTGTESEVALDEDSKLALEYNGMRSVLHCRFTNRNFK